MNNFEIKKCILILIGLIFLTDLAIFLNIPFLRQVLGFLFLTILPGVLIIQLLKLDKIELLEKFVLSVGFSISFLLFFGLLLNNSSLALGYEKPLATIPLLISFNVAFVVLTIVGYRVKKEPPFSLPNLNLNVSEKAFLIVPILFPALSIFGTYFMNTTNSNTILMFLLFLIPIYVTFVCLFNHKFPKRLYPVVIFLISISLVLMFALRSNHIIGIDRHTEYYYFLTTLGNLHWSVFGHSTLDACLSISILPTIYQSILNVNQEYLCKILIPVVYSISPLIIYIISKKYIGETYAFLAAFFFISQRAFVSFPGGRTKIAIFFFGLAMMTLFSDRIDPLKKRFLFIVFMSSCIVSHYATAYIFFFIMLGTFIGIEILPRKYTVKKVVNLTTVLLFFALIFFWYSQVTETAFNAGVGYIENTLSKLNTFFIVESRRENVQTMFGANFMQSGIPSKIAFVFTWLTFVVIGIGIITLIRRYKEMSFPELNFRKPDFLKNKFEVTYFLIALACAGLLVAFIALPWISKGYGIDRLYATAITILSVFFVIGGISLSKHFFFLQKKTCAKRKNNRFFGKSLFSKERFEEEKTSQIGAYLVILLVLIPYFFCVTGVTHQMFGYPNAITLNSEGNQYDMLYVHDQDSYGAKWLGYYADEKAKMYAGFYGYRNLLSQGKIRSPPLYQFRWLSNPEVINGYIYLRYSNIMNGELIGRYNKVYNMSDYQDVFLKENKIYSNGGSEVWR